MIDTMISDFDYVRRQAENLSLEQMEVFYRELGAMIDSKRSSQKSKRSGGWFGEESESEIIKHTPSPGTPKGWGESW